MPRARAKKGGGGAEGPSKAWLDSYADAMTLLLAFFILLYASSIVDEDLFIDFKIGVAQALGNPLPVIDGGIGVLDTGNGVVSLVAAAAPIATDGAEESADIADINEITELNEVTRANAAEVVELLEQQIEAIGASQYVDVVDDPRGVILRIDSQVLFRSGDAKVLPDGVVVLGTVAEILKEIDNLLVIEGHTDDVPTNGGRWATNWELSTTRATNVLRYLHEIEGVPAVRLSAAGYADTRPIGDNDTPEGRQENRRVEVVVIVAPFAENIIDVAADPEIPAASDFGAEIEDPAAPQVIPPDLLDLSPEPVQPGG